MLNLQLSEKMSIL